MFDDAHTMAVATGAGLDDAVGGAGAVALVTYLLLLPLKFGLAAVIEVAERESNLDLDVVTAGLSPLVTAASTKEVVEDIEGVVMAATASSLLALFQSFMSILVVDSPRLRVDEGFISLRHLDKLALRRVVATAGECQRAANGGAGE